MSLVLAVLVSEGIVMAADSRLTLNWTVQDPSGVTRNLSATSSDSSQKLFATPKGIGISVCGTMYSNQIPISSMIESFLRDHSSDESLASPEIVSDRLLKFMRERGIKEETHFQVSGYWHSGQNIERGVFHVNLYEGSINRLNIPGPNFVAWQGETEVLTRLWNDVIQVGSDGKPSASVLKNLLVVDFFTLQDAVDFAKCCIQITIDSMRFQLKEKTVGGPIDVLVIRPGECEWVSRKALVAH